MTARTSFAGLLQTFFTDRLVRQRRRVPTPSPRTAMRFDCSCGLRSSGSGKSPRRLALDDLDAPFIGAFLDHVEQDRRNSARTRNVRLAAIHAFFRYVAIGEPAHADRCRRILAIPAKRHERRPIAFLGREEIDALLAAPDPATWIGRRDRLLLLLAIQTGLRVSELIQLRCADVTSARARMSGAKAKAESSGAPRCIGRRPR